MQHYWMAVMFGHAMNKKMYLRFRLTLSYLTVSFFLIGFNSCSVKQFYEVNSPDESVHITLSNTEGNLRYIVSWHNQLVIDTSLVSIFPDVPVQVIDTKIHSVDTVWNPAWGQFSEIHDNHNELVLDLKVGDKTCKFFARVFNDGLAFRFEVDSLNIEDQVDFYCEYNIAGDDQFYCPAGERTPLGPLTVNELANSESKIPKLLMPIVIEKSNNTHLAILESDLYAANGFKAMRVHFRQDIEKLVSSSTPKLTAGKMVTPWKVILLSENAGDMVTSTVTVNLATPSKLENTSWIKPGKTLWDWRVHSYTAPDGFTYGINNESYKRFIDFAADKGIEYFLIDDSWYKHASKGHFELSEEFDLKEVSSYAAKKDVGLILYYDRKHGEYGDEELFPYYQSIGMSGIKYGFMGDNVDFSRDAIRQSAESELLIDFHDGPVPFTGVRRTYPNAITREYCHAQQDSRRAFTPETFIKMALVNAIQGPLDMNNGNFDIVGINSGIRQKSPRKANSYFSTVVSEVARTLIIFSGLVCIPDAPEAYEAKADLFEFIQKMPVGRWDESRIIHSKMGEYITTARRRGDQWFVGSVINQKGGTLDIDLDFLEPNKTYQTTFYEDSEETHCKTNPEAYQIRKVEVKLGDLIKAKLAPGGGHAMWIRPI